MTLILVCVTFVFVPLQIAHYRTKVSDAKIRCLENWWSCSKSVEDRATEDAERLFKQFKQYESELSTFRRHCGWSIPSIYQILPGSADQWITRLDSILLTNWAGITARSMSSSTVQLEQVKAETQYTRDSNTDNKAETETNAEWSTGTKQGRNDPKHWVKYRANGRSRNQNTEIKVQNEAG